MGATLLQIALWIAKNAGDLMIILEKILGLIHVAPVQAVKDMQMEMAYAMKRGRTGEARDVLEAFHKTLAEVALTP